MRLLKVVVALVAMPVTAICVGAGPIAVQTASAAVVTPLVKCGSMQSASDSVAAPIILSDCNRPRLTGGSGSNIAVGPAPYPITWTTGKDINYNCGGDPTPNCGGSPSSYPVPGRCPSGLREFDFVGTVATTSGAWTRRYIGDPLEFDVCLTPSFGVVEVVPGTHFMILRP